MISAASLRRRLRRRRCVRRAASRLSALIPRPACWRPWSDARARTALENVRRSIAAGGSPAPMTKARCPEGPSASAGRRIVDPALSTVAGRRRSHRDLLEHDRPHSRRLIDDRDRGWPDLVRRGEQQHERRSVPARRARRCRETQLGDASRCGRDQPRTPCRTRCGDDDQDASADPGGCRHPIELARQCHCPLDSPTPDDEADSRGLPVPTHPGGCNKMLAVRADAPSVSELAHPDRCARGHKRNGIVGNQQVHLRPVAQCVEARRPCR